MRAVQERPTLCGCLLLSLAKFMAVDRRFCDAHMQLLMFWLGNT